MERAGGAVAGEHPVAGGVAADKVDAGLHGRFSFTVAAVAAVPAATALAAAAVAAVVRSGG
ncbi:hypothetical protein GCM10010193_58210 [Kitasatospora atroaurantiaca]